MIELYPAFQSLFKVHKDGSERVTSDYFASEVLARTSLTTAQFNRPEGISWRSIDLRMLMILSQNIKHILSDEGPKFVNVSQFSLNDDESFSLWLHAATQLQCQLSQHHGLTIEITEHVEQETLKKRWESIHCAGIKLAIDDYGTGLSNFDRLQEYPWDYCKFDMSALDATRLDEAAAYCSLSEIVGIAEKVETYEQSIIGINHGLNIQQGYLFSRPNTMNLKFMEIKACANAS